MDVGGLGLGDRLILLINIFYHLLKSNYHLANNSFIMTDYKFNEKKKITIFLKILLVLTKLQ